MAPAPSAKTERLMNLVMTLLRTRRPLTRHEIRRTVEQYQLAASDEAFERMFERDKDELRELGVPLDTVEADAYFDDELGYRIRPDEYVLPEISFEPDELVVLGLAARTWSHGTLGGAAAQALRKLEATSPDSTDAAPGLVEPVLGASEPTFPEILRAVQELREIRFDYRGPQATEPAPRRLQPWRLSQLRGHWYVTGFDLDRQQERVFRLSRIVGEVRRHGRAGAYAVPADVGSVDILAAGVAADGAPVTAEVEVSSGSGIRLRRTAQVVAERSDGTDTWTRLRLEAQPPEWVVSSIAELLTHARAVEPQSVRQGVVAQLDAVIAAHGAESVARLTPAAEDALRAAKGGGPRRHGSSEPATERLSRLLSMVPWLVHRQGIDLGEAAVRLGVDEEQLRADLDLLFMCGYGPMPDELIEVQSEDGQIFIHNAETIARPLRLGWDEAVTLIVGLRALAGVPGLHDDDAVVRTLAKLEHAAGHLAEATERVSARIDEGVDADLLATVRSALAAQRRVHLVYDGAERDERTERDVDLMRVVSVDGRWYAEGWCHRAGATRLFRLDRIREVRVLDVDGTPPPEATTRDLRAGIYQPSPDATTVTLLLTPSARWVAEYYPIVDQARVEIDDALVGEAVTMAVSRPDWLIRLVARLGGAATILEPADLRQTLVRRAAAAREQHTSS